MSLDNLKQLMPGYAKDIKLNLSSLANEETLTDQQKWGTYLASALAGRNERVIREILEEAGQHLGEAGIEAAKTAASLMAMNNVYYRFTHLASNSEYANLPARLRMNALASPGIERGDFELFSLAVSAINACGMCIDTHEAQLRKAGFSVEQIQAVVRIASTVQAASAILDGEQAMQAGTADDKQQAA